VQDGPNVTESDREEINQQKRLREMSGRVRERDWVAPDSRRTVPRRRWDLAAHVAGLKELERAAVLLHPRYSDEPPMDGSKMGGSFLWSADEEWPVCRKHRIPYAPVLQLRREEFPEVQFKPGTDLMQLLWCPREDVLTNPALIWRKRSAVTNMRTEMPSMEYAYPEYVPLPCRLFPERVAEYPDYEELPPEVETRLPDRPPKDVLSEFKRRGRLNDTNLTEKDRVYAYIFHNNYMGIKLGGWPKWVRRPAPTQCPQCNRAMDFLLEVDNSEQSGDVIPVQEAHLLKANIERNEYVALKNALNAPGVMSSGLAFYFFLCRRCNLWRLSTVWQRL
jgi:hypothetical protein